MTTTISCLLFSLALLLCLAETSQGAPQYSITCASCHAMPPADSPTGGRDPAARAVKGNHQSHVVALAPSDACVACHGAAVSAYLTGHRDGVIQMSANLNSSPVAASYSRGTFFNQTSVSLPTLGTCANANCHFETTTENWGLPPASVYSTIGPNGTTCAKCHGAPPADGSHPAAAGSGKKHGDYYGTGIASCVKCHPDHTTFSHATSAGNRALILQFTAAPNTGTGTYSKSANLNYPNYLPSQTAAANRNGFCSNLYCHSNGTTANAPFTSLSTARWGGTLDCKGCHGSGAAGGAEAIATNRHDEHTNQTAVLGTNFGCVDCHAKTVSNDTTISSTAMHVNKFKDYSGAKARGSANYVTATGVCSNLYCHSSGQATPKFRNMTGGKAWIGTGTLSCEGCHGYETTAQGAVFNSVAGEPNYTSGAAGSATANTHQKHVTAATDCAKCHTDTANAAGTAIAGGSLLHVDRTRNVNFAASYDTNGGTNSDNYAAATKTCSAVYCHGAAAPQWGGALADTAECDSCHGGDSASTATAGLGPIATNRHDEHVNQAAVLGTNFGCVDCHAKTVSANRTIANAANHGNTFKDYSGAKARGSANYVSATGVCSNLYCHSSGQATPKFRNMTGGKAWIGTGTLSCEGCHGYETTAQGAVFNSVAGEPNYTSGAAGSATANTHQKHVTAATDCAKCHTDTANAAGTAIAGGSLLHVDRTRNVNFAASYDSNGGTNSDNYAAATKTCSAVYCHGSGAPVWGGDTATVTCEKCHGSAATNPFRDTAWNTLNTDAQVGAHVAHLQASSLYSDPVACAQCHTVPVGSYDAGHIDSALPAEVPMGGAIARANSTFPTYSTATGRCATTYCHGSKLPSSNNGANTKPVWSQAAYLTGTPSTTGDCKQCHGFPPNSAGHGSVPGTSLGDCTSCHSHVNTDGTFTAGANRALHINGLLEGGISNGGQTCYGCHGAYQTAMEDGSLTRTGATRANFYHHVVGSATQEGDIAPNTGAYPTSTSDVFCVSCHTDHNYFNAAKGANLRTGIAAAGSSVSSTDYSSTTPYGICVSCHSSKRTKQGMGTDQKGFGSYTTPVIDGAAYGTSMHNYTSNSAFGASAFQANCSKCHTDEQTKDKQTSAQKFGTHYSAQISVLNTMGITAPGEYLEENFCYRCHSKTTDTTPGGGPAKTVANKDYFGSQAMVASSEDIFTAFKGIGVSSYTTTASAILYLRNTAAINTVPPGTRPASYKYSSGTYTTNVFNDRDMAPTSGATNGGGTISTGATAARYNRGYQFVSPQIDNTVTIPSGSTFTLTIRESRATGTSTDYTRLTVYKWNGLAATPLNTSAAPNNFAQNATAISTTATNRSTTFTTNSAVTLNPGDVLVCDVEFYHSAGTTALNVTYAFGLFATDGAQLALPAGTYNWRTGSSTKAGHNVAAYSGKHKINETLAYIAANKHVECADCHNPHAAGQAKHTQGTNAVSAVLSGVPGAIPSGTYGTTGTGTNWNMGTTTYSLGTATKEYQVCFKCHSGANASLATWNAAWTDVALEFNPSNQSYHPVVAALPATDPGVNGSSQLAATQTLTGGWVRGQTMYCSDCHGNDAASPAAQGPHGSAQAFILKGPNTYWPKNSSGALYTLGNNPTNNSHLAGLFCMNCHVVQSATGASVNNAHTEHAGPQIGNVACVSCHILVPHGGKISRLVGDKNTMPTRYAYQGTLTNMYMESFTKAATPTGYAKANCYSTTAACNTHNIAASENW